MSRSRPRYADTHFEIWIGIAVCHHHIEVVYGTETEIDDWFEDAKRASRIVTDRPRELYRWRLERGSVSMEIAGIWEVPGVKTRTPGGAVWRPRHPKETWKHDD